ncbi:hypothetical protein KM043_017565 [Ampulex compressa]|nr:hypothetical protein KM043_017565 [Ampulex compressa]
MGNESSLPMELCSNFDADEIRRLGKRFRKLDLDNSGALSIDEFMSLPELQQNPLVQRVIDIFDADGNGEVDFKEFIHGVSQFSVKGDKESKLRFAFRIYDMDNDGFISNGELFQVLKMMTRMAKLALKSFVLLLAIQIFIRRWSLMFKETNSVKILNADT